MSEVDPTFGLPGKTAWRTYQVKGNLVAARARYVRERWGPDGAADVAARLPPSLLALFQGNVLPFAWYPFPEMAEIDRAIVTGPMGGDQLQMNDFGSTIARYDLSTLYKMLFKIGSPAFFLKRMNVVYSTYVRGGAIESTSVTKGRAVVVQSDGDLPYYFCDQGIPGWFRAAIELSGGQEAKVTHIECVHRFDARCTWEATWTG